MFSETFQCIQEWIEVSYISKYLKFQFIFGIKAMAPVRASLCKSVLLGPARCPGSVISTGSAARLYSFCHACPSLNFNEKTSAIGTGHVFSCSDLPITRRDFKIAMPP